MDCSYARGDTVRVTAIEEGTERTILRKLHEEGPKTEKQIAHALGVDQIDEEDIAARASDAASHGVIEPVEGSEAVRRWQISDKGRQLLGDMPGR